MTPAEPTGLSPAVGGFWGVDGVGKWGGQVHGGARVLGRGVPSEKRGMAVGLWRSIGRQGGLWGHGRTAGGSQTHCSLRWARLSLTPQLNSLSRCPRPAAMSEAEEEYEE